METVVIIVTGLFAYGVFLLFKHLEKLLEQYRQLSEELDEQMEEFERKYGGSNEHYNESEILEVIEEIMIKFGPDGHIDGADKITDFIEAIIIGNEREWVQNAGLFESQLKTENNE